MKRLSILCTILACTNLIAAQILPTFVPSKMTQSSESEEFYDIIEMDSKNINNSWGANFYQNGELITTVKAALVESKKLDFDEKEYKSSLGYNLLNFEKWFIRGTPFILMEYDDEGVNHFTATYSIIMHNPEKFEFQTFVDNENYTSSKKQFHYVINSKNKSNIFEIILYLQNKIQNIKGELVPQYKPTEKVYIEDFNIHFSKSVFNLFIVGNNTQPINIACHNMETEENLYDESFRINSDGRQTLEIQGFSRNSNQLLLTIEDYLGNIILKHNINSTINIKIPKINDININNGNDEPNVINSEIFNTYPTLVRTNFSLAVNAESNLEYNTKTIRIFSQQGELMKEQKFDSRETNVDMDGLKKGIYYVQLTGKETVSISSVVKI